MNIETVKELIAYLESAGELSIREQKFLKLAKEFRICSASLDAAIKTGNMLADQNAQLAAENVALKESRNNLAEFIHEELDADYPLNMNLETPATDRIVAGIKADGVEDMANHFFKLAKDEANSLIAEQWRESGRVANEQAKQLREGADK
ncbi:TPA: hypothetical protein NQR86_003608 [Klebsiella pneumoniae]|nr:hypothetical protein AI2754V5_1307 [Klebsiella pneumoniae]CAH4128088.1 hypothetical protein AI2754V5_1307 [Klebsiella pneumoniae]HCJ2284232.1 hypothetical protein [Klebsiella pneumoniae]